MKTLYIDIMEKTLFAYTKEKIRQYIDEVKRDGLTEHGFPRMAANIGILMAHGRRLDLKDFFFEIMDICCDQMPKKRAANDFSIREVCCALMLMEEKGTIEQEHIDKWRAQLSSFDPWNCYSVVDDHSGKFVANWALFAAASEYIRGVFCGIDTSEFVEWQLPCQLANFDEFGMYKDHDPGGAWNPVMYDLVPRYLFAFLISVGYNGKYAHDILRILDKTVDITMKMQSVTGEAPFGGRSNQYIHNEAMLISYFEMEASRFAKKGDILKAGQLKGAAHFAAKAVLKYLSLDPVSHVKNRYDVSTKIGCESYGYFNKYMVTTASNIYMGHLFANDNIVPLPPVAKKGGYAISTGDAFHKTFLNAGGYCIEIDTNADYHYDAKGLGRVHKEDSLSTICLSVPFPLSPSYVVEGENKTGMSICCYAQNGEEKLIGAQRYAKYHLLNTNADENGASARLEVKLSDEITVEHQYTVSKSGVDIAISGYDDIGFMVPVFDFDGHDNTSITLQKNLICVEHQGSACRYSFDGEMSEEYTYYYNRNGRYRVYTVNSKKLHIELE